MPQTHTSRRAFLKTAPLVVVAATGPAPAFSAPKPDGAIIAAWERRVAAHRQYNGSPVGSAAAEAAFWPVIDECDTIIQATTATTPLGVELQIWTGLHNSSAYHREEEDAILARDLIYIEQHKTAFDWDAQPIIAAIRSLRSMGGL